MDMGRATTPTHACAKFSFSKNLAPNYAQVPDEMTSEMTTKSLPNRVIYELDGHQDAIRAVRFNSESHYYQLYFDGAIVDDNNEKQ